MMENETINEPPTGGGGLSRRTVVGASLWSVPAILLTTSTPALAASNSRYRLSVLPTASVLAVGASPVGGVLTTEAGQPVTGAAMTLLLGTSSAMGTTDGTGTCSAPIDLQRRWAAPGSSASITALANGLSESTTTLVVGANLLVGADNNFGQLGTGQSGPQVATLTQSSLVFPSPVVDVSAAGEHAMALLADGTVWTTGTNGNGALGDGTFTDRFVWGKVPGLSDVISITTTLGASHALTSNGDVWAWGDGANAQLGQEDSSKWGSKWPSPQKVKTLPGATQLASTVARAVFALISDGTVQSWGAGFAFQRGDGDANPRGTAAAIAGLSDVVQLASGFGFGGLALKKDGTVWAWGGNDLGQLCDGTTAARATPAPIAGLSGMTAVSGGVGKELGWGSGFALKNDGTVWSWGANDWGQLGDGTTANRTSPVQVTGVTGATQITGSIGAAYALLGDGRLAAWGSTRLDPIYDTTTAGFVTPARPITKLRASQHNTQRFNGLYLITGQTVLSVEIADQMVTAGTASQITVKEKTPGGVAAAGVAVRFAASRGAVLGGQGGSTDSAGELSTTVTPDPWTMPGDSVRVTVADDASEASASVTVVGANLLVGADNNFGQLGTGQSGPQVATLTQSSLVFPSPVVDVSAAGEHAMALLADGTVWTTGTNGNGALGDGTFTDRFVWGKVPGLSDVISITTTLGASHALTSNGDVWAWGDGANAQLGQEDSSKWGSKWPSPQKVKTLPGATQLASTVARAVFALISDGTVQSWGAGFAFQRGDGDANPRGTAAAIAGLSDVVQLASGFGFGGLALKKDGTVWAWGGNDLGQLCDGTTAARATPAPIAGLSGMTAVSGGVGKELGWGSGFALKNDGTVWSWGANDWGQLGDGTTANRTSPVQVTGVTGATQITGSIGAAYALLGDGRLAAWGSTRLDPIYDTTTAGFVTPARPITKLRASQHNTQRFNGLYLITE